jgi:hypothetical protein
MQDQATHGSGHVFRVQRKRGPQWYVRYRVGAKQVQKRLGPAWDTYDISSPRAQRRTEE